MNQPVRKARRSGIQLECRLLKQIITTNVDAVHNPESINDASSHDSNEVNNGGGIMKRRGGGGGNNKKTSRVTVKEEFLLLPPAPAAASDQSGKGGFAFILSLFSRKGHLCRR